MRIATKRIATKGIATKGIAFPDLSDLCEKHMFYKIGHNSSPRGSPDMILTAFDVRFNEKKMRYLPGLVTPRISSYIQYWKYEGEPETQKWS